MGKRPVNSGINSENTFLLCLLRINHAQIYSLWIEIDGASMLSYTTRFWMDQKIINTSSHQEYNTKMVEGNLTLPW